MCKPNFHIVNNLPGSNRSDAVPWICDNHECDVGWMNGASSDLKALSAGTSYLLHVSVSLAGSPSESTTRLTPLKFCTKN